MCLKKLILTTCVLLFFSGCQPVMGAKDTCLSFVETFNSVKVQKASLDSDYLNKPLPETLRKLEAGYDRSCRVGGVADIYIECPKGKDLRARTIIHEAPVIWTEPEGFTVVIISEQDHAKLAGRELFWARCNEGT